MKIWGISDSHGYHNMYKIPNIDMVIFCGDESNYKSASLNEQEFYNWVEWFKSLPIKYKLYIPGNHSSYVYHNEKFVKKLLYDNNIKWMHKEKEVIEDITFYGDATTPTYGDWFYMCARHKINRHWENIPDGTEVLITHGPPKGILDLTINQDNRLEQVGDGALRSRLQDLDKLQLHCFGHIHNYRHIINAGIFETNGIKYANCAGVEDNNFDKGIIFNGNIINI